ncbi:MAG: OmpA family protein [Solirubrobacterales bacterium]|nr:OmpA family protein [Solirubrobacterales bacterium]
MARHRERRRGSGHDEEDGNERWLLSYADMMTLLVALFMVLFSISSVNTSKYEGLQRSLKDAFSGRVLPGGTSVASAGGAATDNRVIAPPRSTSPQPQLGGRADAGTKAQLAAQAQTEAESFRRLKRQIDAFAVKTGIAGQVSTRVSREGLHIRVLTDKLLFDSGSAAPKAASFRLLAKLGSILAAERRHRVIVEGHTDSVPISSTQFPSNWELSAARASAVVRAMLQAGVEPDRLTASGRADRAAVTANDTPAGRQLNRRVEMLLPREAALTSDPVPDAASTTPAPITAGDPDLTHPLGTRIVPLPATEAHP